MTEPTHVTCALDPGIAHVGYGVVGRYGAKLELIESGHITTSADDDLNVRLRRIWRELALVVRDLKPELFGVENQANAAIGARQRGLEAAAQGRKGGGFNAYNDQVFEVCGIAKAVAFAYAVPVMLYMPQQAKIAVCGKGKGSAKKSEVVTAIGHYFPGLEHNGKPISEHEADAIAGAIYCERVTYLTAKRVRRAG